MPKIAASIVFPVSSPARRNAVVETDEKGTVISLSADRPGFSEIAGVAYYSGILIPGLADMMCGRGKSSRWMVSRGLRLAGHIGVPPEMAGKIGEENMKAAGESAGSGPSENPLAGVNWKSRYGPEIGYRVFRDMEQFYGDFTAGTTEGVYHFRDTGGEFPVLATLGRQELWELIFALQEGPARISLPQLLVMATLNGARAMNSENIAGTLSPGKQPGINIIEGADMHGMKLLPGSRIRRLY